MRSFATLSSFLFFILLGSAQWAPLGTGMLSDRSMTSINGDLYVATYPNGVKKSVDGTGPWTPVNTGLPDNGGIWYVQSVGTDGAYLYAGTESGIYRSTSGTDTWSSVNGTLAASPSVYANKFFSIGGSIMAVFAGTIAEGGGIWRSSNFGNTWLIGHSGMGSNATIYHLTLVDGTLWASTSTGLWKSTDNAQNWTLQANVNYAVYSLAASNGRLVVASAFGIRYSPDGGANWMDATGGPASPTNGELVAFDGKLYALFDSPAGCLRSSDDGTSWTDYNTGFSLVDQAAQEEFFVHGNTLYCTALFDIYSITGSGSGIHGTSAPTSFSALPTVFSDGFLLQNFTADGTVRMMDAMGRDVRIINVLKGQPLWIQRAGAPAGAYSLWFTPASGTNGQGRVLRVLAL